MVTSARRSLSLAGSLGTPVWLAALLLASALGAGGCGDDQLDYQVSLAPDSPWPKFRHDARQTGLAPLVPTSGGALWQFPTGKGIFSTPVIGGDGTVYVGSADRHFYAIAPDGTERWSFETGEIIDSSALLDDQGRVIFGSGDGHLYALDATTGDSLWTFQADDPAEHDAFIRWFEGNVAIGRGDDLYVPNDNFYLYSIDRTDGSLRWRFDMPDQTWSLPAVDPDQERIYVGNNNVLPAFGDNLYAIGMDGKEAWSASIIGTIAASPLFTTSGKIIVGGFDGYVRSYDQEFGILEWSFGARDHIYASPAEMADGTIIQPAADGTVYALDPETGTELWAFDAREPIRSSPAIDGDGNIYFGSGEGRLFVLGADGTLRWAIQLIDEDRNDLNSSPALGSDAIYLAGENGTVFSIPYDYCLTATEDPRCLLGPDEDLPDDGALLLYTTPFGSPVDQPPAEIDANQPLAFSLFVRQGGDTELALIDSDSLVVSATPAADLELQVSGDRKFVTVTPSVAFTGDESGDLELHIEGDYLEEFDRTGLQFQGGQVAGSFSKTFSFHVSAPGPATLPLPVPSQPGDPAGVWELRRLAAPLPTILPSYNQIGFDSLHYLVGVVEPGLVWVIGGMPVEGTDQVVVDPATGVEFPMEMRYADGLLTLDNDAGFALEVMAFALELDRFRIAARLDDTGDAPDAARVVVGAVCADIPMYGGFVRELGFCNPQTDVLNVFGGALLRPHGSGSATAPTGLGTVAFERTDSVVTATLTGSELRADQHVLAVLLVDAATGQPVRRDYSGSTHVVTDDQGRVTSVTITTGADAPASLRVHLMVDTYPAATATLPVD